MGVTPVSTSKGSGCTNEAALCVRTVLNLGPVENEQARQVDRLVRGDAARYAEDGFLGRQGALRLSAHGCSTSPRRVRMIFLSSQNAASRSSFMMTWS